MSLPTHTSDFRSGQTFSAWWRAGAGLAQRGVATTGRTVILRAQKALNVIFMSTITAQAITLIATQEGALALDATIGERTLRRLEVAARFLAEQNLVPSSVSSSVQTALRERRINSEALRFIIWIGLHHSFQGNGQTGDTSAVFDVPFAAIELPSGLVYPQVGTAPGRDVPSGQVRVWNPTTDTAPVRGPVAGGTGSRLTVSQDGTPQLSDPTVETVAEESWFERNKWYIAGGAAVIAAIGGVMLLGGKPARRRRARRSSAPARRKQLGAGSSRAKAKRRASKTRSRR